MTWTRWEPALITRASSTGTGTIPNSTTLGTYFFACADDTAKVTEINEGNNCLAAAGTVQLTLPHLVETAVSNPPATALPGSSFEVTDTVLNQGVLAAGTSTTRYYLSPDQVRDAGDKQLTGSRDVPSLAPGATSTGTVTLTIPGNTKTGTYFVLACTDDTTSVAETNEANNCIASAAPVVVTP